LLSVYRLGAVVSSFVGALGWWLEAAFRVVAVEQRVRRVGGLARFVVGEPGLQVEKPDVLSNHRGAAEYHGVDVYTTTSGDAQGAITFKWQFTSMYTSDTDSACQGPWHITGGTGAYEGAQGGGTALDLYVDEYNGTEYTGTSCSDTLNGKIQVP
jgi:hypothetical protein